MADEIYQLTIEYPGGMGETNNYFIKGDKGFTVIDTGFYSEQAIDVWKKVLEQGYSIEKIVLTHVHQDHIGMARWLQESYDLPIVVSKKGQEVMKKHGAPNYFEIFNGLLKRHGIKTLPNHRDNKFIYHFEPDFTFENEGTIQLGNEMYEIIWTPGHSYDHYCFYNRERKIMIAGDHILKHISPVIGLWEGEEMDVLQYYFDSLEKISSYKVDIALTGHGEPIGQYHDRISQLRRSHNKRLEQVEDLVQKGKKTAFEMTQEIYGGKIKSKSLSPFMATLTRLIYLEEIGKAKRLEEKGVYFFTASDTE